MNDDILTHGDHSYQNYVQNAETWQKGSSYQKALKGPKEPQKGPKGPKMAQ